MDPITIAMALAQFAPGVIKYITGSDKAEAAATAVVDIAKKVTGKATGDEALAAIQADPNLALQYQQAIIAADLDLQKAFLQDVQNAREQTIKLAESGSAIAWAPVIISAVIVCGFFGCVALLFGVERTWDERTANLLNVLFGALIPGFSQVCNYWLGSSAGSKRAGDSMRKIAEQAAR